MSRRLRLCLLLAVVGCSSAPKLVYTEVPTGTPTGAPHMLAEVEAGDIVHYWQWRATRQIDVAVWSSDFAAATTMWHQSGKEEGKTDGKEPRNLYSFERGTFTLAVHIPPNTPPGAHYLVYLSVAEGEDLQLHTRARRTWPAPPVPDSPVLTLAAGEETSIVLDPGAPVHPQLGAAFQRIRVHGEPGSRAEVSAGPVETIGCFANDRIELLAPMIPCKVSLSRKGEGEAVIFARQRAQGGTYHVSVETPEWRSARDNAAFLEAYDESHVYAPRETSPTPTPPAQDPKAPLTSESHERELKIRQRDRDECNTKCSPHLEICIDSCENFTSPRMCIAPR